MRTINLIPVLVALSLGACKSEDSPAPAAPTPSTGRIMAPSVQGLRYVCGDLAGVTNANGEYEYYPGEAIEFLVGNASLGAGPAIPKMTLLDLANGADSQNGGMVNRAKFLLSIDKDGRYVNGITISQDVAKLVDRAMDELDIKELNFDDDGDVNRVTFRVFVWATELQDHELDLVDSATAQKTFETMLLDENLYRASLSREPRLDSAGPNLLIARNLVGSTEPTPTLSTRQLVATWSEEVGKTDAHDAFAAVSLDQGRSWETYNLSHSAVRSSYSTKGGHELPGDTGPVAAVIADDRFLAAWSSRFCPDDNPLDLKRDPYGVIGAQKAPIVHFASGEAPFGCVWVARGIITGDGLKIRFPEQITSGVRDASQVRVSGAPNVGFTVAWTEDVKGASGMPSAGTDVWMTKLAWADFEGTVGPYEKVPTVKFAAPVRLTDNAACRYEPYDAKAGARPPMEWLAAHQTEGEDYCNDVCVGIGKDGYCLTADGVLLSGAAAATDLELALVREPMLDVLGGAKPMGHTLIAWEELRGSRLEGRDVRIHTMAPFAGDAIIPGSVANRPDRIGINPRIAAQDVTVMGARGTRYAIAYQEMDALFPAESALMMRYARDGFDANALGQPVQIATADGGAHLGNIALRGEGLAVAYTAGSGDGTRNAFVRVSTDGGTSFSAKALDVSHLASGSVDASEPSVVWSMESEPMLFATYATHDGDLPGDLYYARSTDLGATFDTVPLIDPDSGDAMEVFDHLAHSWADESDARVVVAPDGDDLYAIWLQEGRLDSDIWFRPIAY